MIHDTCTCVHVHVVHVVVHVGVSVDMRIENSGVREWARAGERGPIRARTRAEMQLYR